MESAIDHYPPLSKALIDMDWQQALALVARGADVSTMDPSGMTPLHWASMYGRADLVSAILAAVGDGEGRKRLVDQPEDDSPCTALHWAIRSGNSHCALALIDAGSDLGAADDGGHTALHLACHFGLADVVSALLQRGPNVWAEGPCAGDTPHEAAVAARRSDCVGLRLDWPSTTDPPLSGRHGMGGIPRTAHRRMWPNRALGYANTHGATCALKISIFFLSEP